MEFKRNLFIKIIIFIIFVPFILHAGENKDDLVVLGARHQKFLEATFFGKTTELVMRHAPCPVLITPFLSES